MEKLVHNYVHGVMPYNMPYDQIVHGWLVVSIIITSPLFYNIITCHQELKLCSVQYEMYVQGETIIDLSMTTYLKFW